MQYSNSAMRKNYLPLLFLLVLFLSISAFGQDKQLWSELSNDRLDHRDFKTAGLPEKFRLYELDIDQLRREIQNGIKRTSFVLQIPDVQGEMVSYQIEENAVLHPDLKAKYPQIKSLQGLSLKDKTSKIRLVLTDNGLHAMVTHPEKGIQIIDPSSTNKNQYISFKREDLHFERDFVCSAVNNDLLEKSSAQAKIFDDRQLRTYRLALACTGEYADYHIQRLNLGGATDVLKKVAVLAEMVVAISRVNEIYENDLAITFQLVANNDDLIYLDGSTDPYSNDSGTEMLNENQSNVNAVIGTANYDIGHVFSTGGGGIAVLGATCSTSKAKGVTGLSNPIGDFFYMDYVAHEIGHQMGANHTFNGDAGLCGGNGNTATAVEPGSGSTLMSYAGLCTPQNVQNSVSFYFHTVSINEIWNHITSGVGSTCGAKSNLNGNQNIPVANAGLDYTIPKGTAFVLRGTGSDADNDPITFAWEQIDNQLTTVPPSATSTVGALYRSVTPKTSGQRYMPNLETLAQGKLASTWEVTPSVARTLNFALTVRDNNAQGGQTARDDARLTVSNVAGPFLVTSQNTEGLAWEKNSTQTITWDVAGTNSNGINVNQVNILLSTDGGKTYPTALKTNTPNDGTEQITVPDQAGAKCFVMVEAVNHIFLAVNSKSFSIGVFEENCDDFISSDVPLNIPSNDITGIESKINITEDVTIERIEVSVDLSHTYIYDISLTLISPQGTEIRLLRKECNTGIDDLNAVFSDDGAALICSNLPPAISGSIKPLQELSTLVGESSLGEWKLKIVDDEVGDLGTLNAWSINICSSKEVLGLEEFGLKNFVLYPNPTSRNISVAFNSAVSGKVKIEFYDLLGRQILTKNYEVQDLFFKEDIDLSSVSSGVYMVRVSNEMGSSTRKVIVRKDY